MKELNLYHPLIPEWMKPYLDSEAMIRLKGIDMNCGMNYTSFPFYRDCEPYSRYEHSLGVALIVNHFTHDKKQVLAGLFHDIATPAFSHVIDFVYGDHLKQETTESDTKRCIMHDARITELLKKDSILIDEVSDYHLYPIADNASPCLSSDRLEYTLSNALDYHYSTLDEIRKIYEDITILKNEKDEEELGFQQDETAIRFTVLALKCGKIYSSKENRYAMEKLARLLKKSMHEKILLKEDYMLDEKHVIDILKHSKYKEEWNAFQALSKVYSSFEETEGSLQVKVKKRYIDPLCSDGKRVSEKYGKINNEIASYLEDEMQEYLKGDSYEWKIK